jgi:ankyrin repeat protein
MVRTWRTLLMAIALVAMVALVAVPGVPLRAASSDAPVADAAMRRDLPVVRDLLKQGGDVNAAQGDGMTALHWAAADGNLELARMLLYAGANPNATTRLGSYTPLHIAAKNGHASLVEALLQGGADAKASTAEGTTALMFAAEAGNLDAMKSLLDHGADVNAREKAKGETALMFASASDRVEAVKLLLQHGADTKIATAVLDWSKLPKTDPRLPHFGRRSPSKPAAGAKATAKPSEEEAASAEPAEEPAAKAEPADEADETAEAAKAGLGKRAAAKAGAKSADAQAKAIEDLFDGYAKLVGKQGGLTALLFASRQGNTDTVQALLDGGADINQVDLGQHTSPLLVAVVNGHFDLAE